MIPPWYMKIHFKKKERHTKSHFTFTRTQFMYTCDMSVKGNMIL